MKKKMPKRIAEKNASRQHRYSVKQKATENEEKKLCILCERDDVTGGILRHTHSTLRRTAYERFDVAQQCSAPVAQQIQQIYMVHENLGAKSGIRRKNDAFTNGLCSVWQAELGGRFISARRQHSRRSLLPLPLHTFTDVCLCQCHRIISTILSFISSIWKAPATLPSVRSMNTNRLRLRIKIRKFLCFKFNSLRISFVRLENLQRGRVGEKALTRLLREWCGLVFVYFLLLGSSTEVCKMPSNMKKYSCCLRTIYLASAFGTLWKIV